MNTVPDPPPPPQAPDARPVPATVLADAGLQADQRLEAVSREALAAARTGDLIALAIALEDRERALADGEPATDIAFQLGEEIRAVLEIYRRQAGMEAARLKQMEEGFATSPDLAGTSGYVNCQG